MKNRPILIVFSLSMALLIVSCGNSSGGRPPADDTVATIVAGTLDAMTREAVPVSTNHPDQKADFTPIPSMSDTPSPTPTPGLGAISGGIYGYPYGPLPRLTMVAFNQQTGYIWWWYNEAGMTFYSTDAFIEEGIYRVVAYDASGNSGGCLTSITVKVHETAVCDITDWVGSYPPKPALAPDP